MVILEEIRSQNRATIEAVDAHRQESSRELQAFGSEIRGDIQALHAVVREHGADVRQLKSDIVALKEQITRLDAVITADYRDRLHRLEERMDALEHRTP